MKKLAIYLMLLICSCGWAQLAPEYIETFRKKPKQFTLDILKQEKKDGEFVTTKHTRYEVDRSNYRLQSQKVYDTISNIPYNKMLTYSYDDSIDENLIQIETTDFDGTMKKQENYTYDDKGFLLLKKMVLDESEEIVESITYDWGDCPDKSVLQDLPEEDQYTCEERIFSKPRLNTSRKEIHVFNMYGVSKEIRFKNNGDLSNTVVFSYDENGKLIKETKTTSTGRGYDTQYTYNEHGDKASTKASFVEFSYAYEYDEHGNWTTMIETSKVPSKRVVYKRRLTY